MARAGDAARHGRRDGAAVTIRPAPPKKPPPSQARLHGQGDEARVHQHAGLAKAAATGSVKSNCVSVEPLATEFAASARSTSRSCNQDYSCVEGFCPSFITLEGAQSAQSKKTPAALTAESTPLPPEFEAADRRAQDPVHRRRRHGRHPPWASILAMAAHIDGRAGSVVDMTGLAQKGGSVFSHVKIGETEETIVGGRVPAASADVLIACDLLVAALARGPVALRQGPHPRLRQQRLRPDRRLCHQPRRQVRQRRHGAPGQGRDQHLRRLPGPAPGPRPSSATPSTPT